MYALNFSRLTALRTMRSNDSVCQTLSEVAEASRLWSEGKWPMSVELREDRSAEASLSNFKSRRSLLQLREEPLILHERADGHANPIWQAVSAQRTNDHSTPLKRIENSRSVTNLYHDKVRYAGHEFPLLRA